MMLIWENVNLTNLLAIPGLAPCNAAADNFPPQSVSGFPGYQSPPTHLPAARAWGERLPHRGLPLDTPGSSPDVGEEEMARTEGELLASGPLGALVFFFLPVCPSHVSKQWTL